VRFLAESPPEQEIAGIFLIATPFCGEGGWELESLALPADLGRRLPRATPTHLYHGDEDEIVPFAHLALYARALPHAAVHALPGRTHQLGNDLSVVADHIRRLA
jgi:pimeloyl-ACP methyl ester carboxylesterase